MNDDNIDVLKTEYTFDQDEFDTLTKKGTGRTKKEDSALKNIIELKNNQEFYNSIFESLIKNRSETKYNERKKFEDFIISCDSNLKLKE
ncbi:hypothetical protein FACS189459_2450 [Bacilli bacterium]|nr:hypothetical protein FACS189459_2450 [Bacilli bacterium]